MDPRAEESLNRNLPQAFINKKGEPILIAALDEKRAQRLVDMYLAYQPRQSFQGLPPAKDETCVKWVRGMIRDGINIVALSFSEGVVGHAALFPIDKRECEYLVVVSPAFQNTGIGTELTRTAIQLAYEIGFEAIHLTVKATTVRARRVYKKCGFEVLSRKSAGELDMALDLLRHHDALDVTVAAVMNTDVVTVPDDATCRQALDLFLERGVPSMPVLGADRQLVGILSKTDLMPPAALDKQVADVLTRAVLAVHPNHPLRKVIRLLQSKRVRCIPVVDADMKLVGVVGRRDILAYYREKF